MLYQKFHDFMSVELSSIVNWGKAMAVLHHDLAVIFTFFQPFHKSTCVVIPYDLHNMINGEAETSMNNNSTLLAHVSDVKVHMCTWQCSYSLYHTKGLSSCRRYLKGCYDQFWSSQLMISSTQYIVANHRGKIYDIVPACTQT